MAYISQTAGISTEFARQLLLEVKADTSLNRPAEELLNRLQALEKTTIVSDLVAHSHFAATKKQADSMESQQCLQTVEQYLRLAPLRTKLQTAFQRVLEDLNPADKIENLCLSVLRHTTFCIEQRPVCSFDPADNPLILVPIFRPLEARDIKPIHIVVETVGTLRIIQPNIAITAPDLNELFKNAQSMPVDITKHPILRNKNYLYRSEFMSLDSTVNLCDFYPQEVPLLPLRVVNQIIDKLIQAVLAVEKTAESAAAPGHEAVAASVP